MQCKNIEKNRVTPDVKLNKAKKKNNKVLLSDYYTIRLPDYDNSEYSEGSGVSTFKRSHFRRGHIRILTKNYEEPRAVWVSHCLVKGQAPGFVNSNYEVRA